MSYEAEIWAWRLGFESGGVGGDGRMEEVEKEEEEEKFPHV